MLVLWGCQAHAVLSDAIEQAGGPPREHLFPYCTSRPILLTGDAWICASTCLGLSDLGLGLRDGRSFCHWHFPSGPDLTSLLLDLPQPPRPKKPPKPPSLCSTLPLPLRHTEHYLSAMRSLGWMQHLQKHRPSCQCCLHSKC